MIIPIYASDHEGDAIKDLLDSVATQHGLVSTRSGAPSRSEAARAILGTHESIGFLLLSNTAVSHVITTDKHGYVTLYLPETPANRELLTDIEYNCGGEITTARGWLSHTGGDLTEADYLSWLSASEG